MSRFFVKINTDDDVDGKLFKRGWFECVVAPHGGLEVNNDDGDDDYYYIIMTDLI